MPYRLVLAVLCAIVGLSLSYRYIGSPRKLQFTSGMIVKCADEGLHDDAKVKDAINRAKKSDKDWFDAVIGNDIDTIVEIPAAVAAPAGSNAISRSDHKSDRMKLLELGYALEEIEMLKDGVVAMIYDNKVRRPVGAIPELWFVKHAAGMHKPTNPCDQRRGARVDVTPVSRSVKRKQQSFSPRRKANTEEIGRSGSATSFSWKGTGPRVKDAEYAEVRNNVVTENSTPKKNLARRASTNEDEEQLSFLPTIPEFRSMLLEETRFRLRAVGDWITPLLRLENKLRFMLYQGFLQFLDNGLGEVVDSLLTALDTPEGTSANDFVPGEKSANYTDEEFSSSGDAPTPTTIQPHRLPGTRTEATWTHIPLSVVEGNGTRASDEVVLKVTLSPRGGYVQVQAPTSASIRRGQWGKDCEPQAEPGDEYDGSW